MVTISGNSALFAKKQQAEHNGIIPHFQIEFSPQQSLVYICLQGESWGGEWKRRIYFKLLFLFSIQMGKLLLSSSIQAVWFSLKKSQKTHKEILISNIFLILLLYRSISTIALRETKSVNQNPPPPFPRSKSGKKILFIWPQTEKIFLTISIFLSKWITGYHTQDKLKIFVVALHINERCVLFYFLLCYFFVLETPRILSNSQLPTHFQHNHVISA